VVDYLEFNSAVSSLRTQLCLSKRLFQPNQNRGTFRQLAVGMAIQPAIEICQLELIR